MDSTDDLTFAERAAACRGAPPPQYRDTDPPDSVRYCITQPPAITTRG